MTTSATVPSVTADPAPTAFERLGEFVVRRARLVLALFVGGVIVAGVVGSQVFAVLGSAGYSDPGSESARAATVLSEEFATSEPILVMAISSPAGVDDPAASADAQELVAEIAATPGVAQVISYWTSGTPPALRSEDGSIGQVIVHSEPDASAAERTEVAEAVMAATGTEQGVLTVATSGSEAVGIAVSETITGDLKLAESVAIPITMIVLMIVFGSVVSAGLPLVVAAGSILGSFLVLWLITRVTDVSIFGLNLITGLGLGLGIDYALLMVNRFREERARGLAPDRAVVRTVATAGRTVAVSGVTVAVTLAALLFFPQYFLRSFGYAGISVTLLAVLSAITALPAAIALLGARTDALRIRRGDLAPSDDGGWARVARAVMRRPVLVAVSVTAVLLSIASLALGASFSQVDDRALPADSPATAAASQLRESFPGEEGAPVQVVLGEEPASDPAAVAAHAATLSQLDGVVRVVSPTEVFIDGQSVGPNPAAAVDAAASPAGWVRLDVVGDVAPRSADGVALVDSVRDVPWAGAALVGGAAAEYADSQAAIAATLPWALAWVLALTVIVLFLYTGSVVLPIKAVLLNILSLAATIGALVWVFQDDHLGWLVGDYQSTGTLDTSMTVLIAIVAFALSMDYEVFLLSRIKEEHDAGADTETAVELGLQRSGRIITAAAVLLAIVFASFLTSGVTPIKQLGFGVAFAILLDATVVRGLLVPAFMRLAGRWNWWAPAPLAALHRRVGLSEG
jgi:RND superfamily putative drug exporter